MGITISKYKIFLVFVLSILSFSYGSAFGQPPQEFDSSTNTISSLYQNHFNPLAKFELSQVSFIIIQIKPEFQIIFESDSPLEQISNQISLSFLSVFGVNNPAILVLLFFPAVVAILFRTEFEEFDYFKLQKILAQFVVILLASSVVLTPLAASPYYPYVFALNSTNANVTISSLGDIDGDGVADFVVSSSKAGDAESEKSFRINDVDGDGISDVVEDVSSSASENQESNASSSDSDDKNSKSKSNDSQGPKEKSHDTNQTSSTVDEPPTPSPTVGEDATAEDSTSLETTSDDKKGQGDKIPKEKIRGPPGKTIVIESENMTATAKPLYTTVDDPSNHVVSAGGELDGIGLLFLETTDGGFLCSGVLLPTGMHVLTAAHCVTDESGIFNLVSGTVTFEDESGPETINIDVLGSLVHPKYDGNFLKGNDIAVLKLETQASSDITRYDIDRNERDDVGSIVNKAGYGMSGTGDTGATFFDLKKRSGQNTYDDVSDTMLKALGLKQGRDFDRGAVLQYDFDNGLAANDGFGFFFGKSDLGLVTDEVSAAPGDSGSPSLNSSVITGITSYGITLQFTNGSTSDVTPSSLDSSFGEFVGDTRVSKHYHFVDKTLYGNAGNVDKGPPPGAGPGPSSDELELETFLDDFDEFFDEDFTTIPDEPTKKDKKKGPKTDKVGPPTGKGAPLDDEIGVDVESILDELDDLFAEIEQDFAIKDKKAKPKVSLKFDELGFDTISKGNAKITTDNQSRTLLELGGQGDYLQLPNDGTTDKLPGLTVSALVKPNYAKGSSEFTIISKEKSFVLSINNKIGQTHVAKFAVFDGIKWNEVKSVSEIPEAWTHLTATFDGSSISIYINGEQEASK